MLLRSTQRKLIAAAMLLTASPCMAADVAVPLSCRLLGRLNGIFVPAVATIEDARAGLAMAEQRADASLPGVRYCLSATRRAIAKAEKSK